MRQGKGTMPQQIMEDEGLECAAYKLAKEDNSVVIKLEKWK